MMERFEEFQAVQQQLDEQLPKALDFAYARAEKRLQQERRRRIMIPLTTIGATIAIFIVMVNSWPSFAYACGQIPLIKELAQLVAFSPSLSAAVENEYVQPIEAEKTQDGITARIEYVIVDQKQLSIFYSTDSSIYQGLNETPSIRGIDGQELEGFSISSASFNEPNGALKQITVDFVNGKVPEGLELILEVEPFDSDFNHAPAAEANVKDDWAPREPEYVSLFRFVLKFDPYFTGQGETITLNQPIMLDGQQLTVSTVEIYPTHMRLNLQDHEGNSAWLQSLSFYVENEKGQRYEAISNGITATGSADSPMMASHRLESPFFSKSKHLTIFINEVTWLDKDMEKIKVDLVQQTIEALPQGVTFASSVQRGDDWDLTFLGKQYKPHVNYQLWGWTYYDEAGTEYHLDGHSSNTGSFYDEATGEYKPLDGEFSENCLY